VTGQQRMLTPTRHPILLCRRSVLPYTRFCNCLFDYGYVSYAVLYFDSTHYCFAYLLRLLLTVIQNGLDMAKS
jgi:hypothetical protein